jgi:hypothetical protein
MNPAYLECRGCHSDDVSIVSRKVVPMGDHVLSYSITYQCNTCGATWTVGEGRT